MVKANEVDIHNSSSNTDRTRPFGSIWTDHSRSVADWSITVARVSGLQDQAPGTTGAAATGAAETTTACDAVANKSK